MSTRITINVTNNKLVQQNKEDQLANRYEWILKQQEDRVAEEIKKDVVEKTAQETAAREGAIPEYRVIEETIATRDEGNVGGWLDVSRMRKAKLSGGMEEAVRFNVACGNGKKWVSVESRPDFDFPIADPIPGPIVSIEGVLASTVWFSPETDSVTNFGPPPEGAVVTDQNPFEPNIFGNTEESYDAFQEWLAGTPFDRFDPVTEEARKTLQMRKYEVSGQEPAKVNYAYLVYPVTDSKAILTTRIHWGARGFLGESFGAIDNGSFTEENTGDEFGQSPKVVFELYWRVPENGAQIPTNLIDIRNDNLGPDSETATIYGSLKFFFYYVFEKIEPDPDLRIDYYTTLADLFEAFPSLVPAQNDYITKVHGPDNFAFVITHDKVKEIEVPDAILEAYDVRYPAFVWSGDYFDGFSYLPQWIFETTGYEQWNQIPGSAHMGASNSRFYLPRDDEGTGVLVSGKNEFYPNTYLYGSPGIFDYLDSGFNDWELIQALTVRSEYLAQDPPLYSPDHTKKKGAFEFLTKYTDGSYYALQWLFLTAEQREKALPAYREWYGLQELEIDEAPKNPVFYYSYLKQTKGGVTYNTGAPYVDVWLDNSEDDWDFDRPYVLMKNDLNWSKAIETISLSPGRKLPPSYAQSEFNRETHPYIDDWSEVATGYSPPTNDKKLEHRLAVISWTAWGKNWSAKLKKLGFKFS